MADALYSKYKEALLSGAANTDMSGGDVKAILVDTNDYTFSQTHEFLSDVPSGARVATSANLAAKTFTNGTFDCADFTWTAATGDQSEAIVFYIDTGSAATSRLIIYKDSDTNLPVSPNGGDITYNVNASGVFTL